MLRPDPRNDNAREQAGTVGEAAIQKELNKADDTPQGTNNVIPLFGRLAPVPRCQYCSNVLQPGSNCPNNCNAGIAMIERVQQRHANLLRCQALGQRVTGGN